MNNKKKIFVVGIFLLCLSLFMAFAGGEDNEKILKSIEFIDSFDDSVVSVQEIQVGESASVPESPKHDDYLFVGWYLFDDRDIRVTDFNNINENLKVIALYAGDKNNNGIDDEKDTSYTVTFVDGVLNAIINTQDVLAGMDAVVPNVAEHDGYMFTGWSSGYTNINKDITITAQYVLQNKIEDNDQENIILYTVTFVDGDTRAVLKTQTVQEGNAAGLPVVPNHEKRVFKEWSGDYRNIRSNRTITAIYVDDLNDDGISDEIQPHYEIGYYDYDDTLIKKENVLVNMPTPIIEDPVRTNYSFNGWTPVVDKYVTTAVKYTATYLPLVDVNKNRIADIDEEKYTVNYSVDGSIVKSYSNLLYGIDTPIYENVPIKSGYVFIGWENFEKIVTKNVTFNAEFFKDINGNNLPDETEEKYVVRYLDENNNEIKSYPNLLINTKTPILDSEYNPVKDGYIFDGWNNFSEFVLSSVDYKAKWLVDSDKDGVADKDEYEIKFIVNDQNISIQYLKENEIPYIPDLKKEGYVLSEWNPTVSKVVKNQVYVARWLEDSNKDGYADINQFKITFKALDKVLVNNYYNTGDKMPIPDEDEIPVKDGYVFVGWGEEVEKTVSKSKEFVAVYELDKNNNKIADSSENKLTIKYLNKDGSVFETFYELINMKTPIPEKYPEANGYIFEGWIDVSEKVTSDVSYNGNWEVDSDKDGVADKYEYEIKFVVDEENVSIQYLKENEMPSIPKLNKEKFVLSDWTPVVSKATMNQNYNAKWLEDNNKDGYADINQFKITFKALDKVLVNNYYNTGDKMPIPDEDEIPVKDGYVFVGWGEEVEKTVSKSKEFIAVYELDKNDNKIADSLEEKYTVRYLNDDGEVIKTYSNLLIDTKTPLLSKEEYPVKVGYVLDGWNDFSETVFKSIDYVPKWLVDDDNDGYADEGQYEVKFFINDELISKQYVNENELPVAPTLTKEGWTLSDWTPEIIINKSQSYNAIWEDKSGPVIDVNYSLSDDSSKAKIIINAVDKASGVKSIKYSIGDSNEKINATNEIIVNSNGKYVIYVEDNNGNISSKSVEIDGIELSPNKDKTFQDDYVNVSFGEVDGIFVNYSLDMQINAKEGVKIKSIKYYQSDVGFLGGLYDFITNSSSGKYLTEDQMKSGDYPTVSPKVPDNCEKYNLKLSSDSADKFTILVEFDYNGESVFALYKVRLAQFVK